MQDQKNRSRITEFILQGIWVIPEMRIPFFLLFLLIYIFTVTGNLLICIVISIDHKLHTPMYFFLCNLSFLDFSYASVIQPKFLSILLLDNHFISFAACMTQFYIFLSLAVAEFFFLTAMAYDRYVAICKPLQYSVLMNNTICFKIAAACWIACFFEPLTHLIVVIHQPLCRSQISHFYCDYSALLRLSCTDTFSIELMTYVFGSVVALPAFSLTLVSYVYIISTIKSMHSTEGRRKTFSTCVPHITVVILFYSTLLIMAMRPSAQYSSVQNKAISLLYAILIPAVNPFIYTLRNKDVKVSLYKIIMKIIRC
ncbi:olfactory receptor 1044-like [Bombina bombina]|uniref:olfactory receptor 1044-like n=1 Tax=Bombina bombina TaxID=8345 RepID=UPI00235B245A|nr:olfactory receptor 1044-like [Bombina bombina]